MFENTKPFFVSLAIAVASLFAQQILIVLLAKNQRAVTDEFALDTSFQLEGHNEIHELELINRLAEANRKRINFYE